MSSDKPILSVAQAIDVAMTEGEIPFPNADTIAILPFIRKPTAIGFPTNATLCDTPGYLIDP